MIAVKLPCGPVECKRIFSLSTFDSNWQICLMWALTVSWFAPTPHKWNMRNLNYRCDDVQKRCLWGAFLFFFFCARWWVDVKESSRAAAADSPLTQMKNIIQDESLCWDGKRLTPFTVLWNWQEATETAAKVSFWLCSFLSLAEMHR